MYVLRKVNGVLLQIINDMTGKFTFTYPSCDFLIHTLVFGQSLELSLRSRRRTEGALSSELYKCDALIVLRHLFSLKPSMREFLLLIDKDKHVHGYCSIPQAHLR